jgi:uncharacterized Zn-binding protein involved in type VI secretion
MKVLNQAITAASASSVPTQAYLGSQFFNFSAQVDCTDAAAAGNLIIQASNSVPPNGQEAGFTGQKWVTIATVAVASGASESVIAPAWPCYYWLRAVWQKSAGAGNVTISVCAQG